jgi:hypothetical protein
MDRDGVSDGRIRDPDAESASGGSTAGRRSRRSAMGGADTPEQKVTRCGGMAGAGPKPRLFMRVGSLGFRCLDRPARF